MSSDIKILRAAYHAPALIAAERYSIKLADVRDRAERLLADAPAELEGPHRWIWAVSAFEAGAYPSGDSTSPAIGWGGEHAKQLHRQIARVNREHGLGYAARDLHGAFWGFCFAICGRVPQELTVSTVDTVVDCWIDWRLGAGARRAA